MNQINLKRKTFYRKLFLIYFLAKNQTEVLPLL